MNTHRDEKKQPDPIELPMPWHEPEQQEPTVTPEERARYAADLAARSAFKD